jgi:hypothetical protein
MLVRISFLQRSTVTDGVNLSQEHETMLDDLEMESS